MSKPKGKVVAPTKP